VEPATPVLTYVKQQSDELAIYLRDKGGASEQFLEHDMSIKSLIAYVDADGMPEKRIRLAANVADKFSATLVGLSALALPPPVVANGVVLESGEAYVDEFEARLAARERWFRGIVGSQLKQEWRQELHLPTEVLVREARCADLVIIGQTKDLAIGSTSVDPGGVILRVGRPTLVVPDGVSSLRSEHVVIGWKDTRESRRAVQDALPFLRLAKDVSIVEICEPDQEKTAAGHVEDVAQYLKRHKIDSHPKVLRHQEESGAAQLIRFAQDEQADLLVTGAYGHSRLGEWIFGGMTRDLLASSPICCLMSH
jgi:nucleotide-binding universal stress UspA family protein